MADAQPNTQRLCDSRRYREWFVWRTTTHEFTSEQFDGLCVNTHRRYWATNDTIFQSE